jgi:hypothetical protein
MNAKLLFLCIGFLSAPLLSHAQSSARISPPDGILVYNNSVYKVQKGFAVIVVGNGIVRGIDGNPVIIPQNHMYTTGGRLIPIPPGITGLPASQPFRTWSTPGNRGNSRSGHFHGRR